MTIAQPRDVYRSLNVPGFASPLQCSEVDIVPAFRRTCSATGFLSTSPQEGFEKQKSRKPAHPCSARGNTSISESVFNYFTSESKNAKNIRVLHGNRTIKEDDHPRNPTRSRSCVFEPPHVRIDDTPSSICTIKDQDGIISSASNLLSEK